MLSETSNNGKLLAMFTKCIELVSESSLELFAGDIGKLSLCDQRLGFSTDKLLFEDYNLRSVWLFVLKLSNLIGNFLLACKL